MRSSWECLKDINYEGMTLVNAGYGYDANNGSDNNKVTQFYVNKVPIGKTPNHFSVTWDFNEFLSKEAANSFEWPTPHAVALKSDDDERKEQLISYFTKPPFVAYDQSFSFKGKTLTIINRPVEYFKTADSLKYYAGAVDTEGNVYHVYWNMFNVFDPVDIVMSVDNSRYCKHCLTRWKPDADTTRCSHEWLPVD